MYIYNITEEYMRLLNDIAEGIIPAEAVHDTLEAVEGELTDKIDNIACYVKSLKAEAEAIRNEISTLMARAKTKQNEADRLVSFIKTTMEQAQKSKLETPRCKITIKQNPEAVSVNDGFIEWAAEHNPALLAYAPPSPDKAKIKESLQAGIKIPGCELTRGERLEIK